MVTSGGEQPRKHDQFVFPDRLDILCEELVLHEFDYWIMSKSMNVTTERSAYFLARSKNSPIFSLRYTR